MTTQKATAAKPAPAAKAPDALAFAPTFEEAEVPATVNTSKVNPYAGIVGTMKGDRNEAGRSNKARQFTVPEASADEQVRALQRAGRAAGVTVRNRRETKDGSVVVTFWLVPQITKASFSRNGEATSK